MTHDAIRSEFQFSQVFNFRDLGGYPGADGRTVRWRRLFRSDTLSGLCEEDREDFLALGVRTVVDLRRSVELARHGRVPSWDGLVHRHIAPEHREWELTPWQDGYDPAEYLTQRYLDLVEEGGRGLAEAIGVIADERAAPVAVHCMAGKDRTGVVCALVLSLLGVTDPDIEADYIRSTAGNQRYIAWARANGHPDLVMLPWYYSPPGAITRFLAELRRRYGSVERCLTDAGLDPAQPAALRAHLLSPV